MATEFIKKNFVSTYEQVSTFGVSNRDPLQGYSNQKVDKQGGNIATYFCTPDGRVLGFLLGPVKGDVLLAGAKLAKKIFEETEKLDSVDEKKKIVRKMHLAAMEKTKSKMSKVLLNVNPNVGQFKSLDSQIADLQLDSLGRTTAAEKICNALRIHHPLAADRPNLFMSFLPYEKLLAIEKPIIEILLHQKYSRVSERLPGVKKRIDLAVAKNKPTILVVRDGEQKKIDQLLLSKGIRKKLANIHLDYVNEADVFAVLSSLNAIKDRKDKKQYFYFFDATGKLVKTMPIMNASGLLYQIKKLGFAE